MFNEYRAAFDLKIFKTLLLLPKMRSTQVVWKRFHFNIRVPFVAFISMHYENVYRKS